MRARSPKSRFRTQVVGVVLAFLFIVAVSVLTLLANTENRKTIAVCKLRENISSGAVIMESNLEKYEMYYKEFENGGVQTLSDGSRRALIVTWANRESVIGKRYASSFLYANTHLLWSMTTAEQNRRHSYLYSMDGELMNIQMNTSDFGEMTVPGDRLNIRVSYYETVYNLPTEEQYMLSQGALSTGVSVQKNEKLFNEVAVLDMLNSDDKSIFDIYYDFISQSRTQQANLLRSESFLESVKPKSILLQVTAEEAEKFMDIQSKSPVYLMTLLPRTSSNLILDSLSDIDKLLKAQRK